MASRQEIIINPESWEKHRYTFSDATVKEGKKIIAISGVTSEDEAGHTMYPGDIEAQCRYIYQRIEGILKAAGATFKDVIKTTDYITPEGLNQYGKTAKVRREFFRDKYSAATGVIVNRLIHDDWLIEVDVIAVV